MVRSKSSPWLKEIPKPEEILSEVLHELNEEMKFEEKVRSGEITPSKAALILEDRCHKKYREYEEGVKEKWKNRVKLDELEKSLMQSRAPRAGATVELIIEKLLELMKIPCQRKVWYPKKNGEQLDIVVPDKDTLLRSPDKAIIISIKRKVRERWREVVGEAYILRQVHGIPDNIWFVTVTCDISNYVIESMTKLNIRVYVPDLALKNSKNMVLDRSRNCLKIYVTF